MYRQYILIFTAFLILTSSVQAKELWVYTTPGDPPLALTVLPDVSDDGLPDLVAGYDSGNIICLNTQAESAFEVLWSATLEGSILALKAMPDADSDGFPEVVATTDLGEVARLSAGGPSAGTFSWIFDATFNIFNLAVMNDSNDDGVREVAFGGADHRVRLLSGKDGKLLWSRFLESRNDFGTYVDCLSNAGDLNGDRIDDIFVRTWGANHWALNGVDGLDLWPPQQGSPFVSTLITARDVNGDGRNELLISGNDGLLRFCNGKDGLDIWTCELGRPLRAIEVSDDVTGDGVFDCFAGNAEGKIACISGAGQGSLSPQWITDLGDVCRVIVSLGDIDQDDKPDIVAGAENGVVAAFSGTSGELLWSWLGGDVIRTLTAVGDLDADGVPEIAVAILDGALALLPGCSKGISSRTVPVACPKVERCEKKRVSASVNDDAQVPILLYHDVSPDRLQAGDTSPLENFREQMDLIVEEGFNAVSLDEIADWINGRGKLPPKPVCITFDGQYASHDTQLFKILRDRGLFAISYITTDWIGTANHLDWHELRRLDQSGVVEIENHSVNHPTLTGVSREEVVKQVSVSNQAIARHLGGKISKHHAYPNGPNNSMVRDVMAEVGFRTATAVFPRKAFQTDNVYNLPRYTIAEDMSLTSFKAIMGVPDPACPPLPYRFAGKVGDGWQQPSFGDVDAEGKLWVCDYSAAVIRVFLPDGTEASFSPLDQGLNQKGEIIQVAMPSGIAITPSGEVLVSIATRSVGLFRYRASDGKSLSGFDFEPPYTSGEVDVDRNGMIYVTDKLTEKWHLYTPEGKEVPGSPFGEDTGFYVKRGISVLPDGSKVYTISETSRDLLVWEKVEDSIPVKYEQTKCLLNHISFQSGGIDVMDDGTIFVSHNEEGMVVAYDDQGRMLGQISGGDFPPLAAPRGVAFDPEGNNLWIFGRMGQVQRWEKISSP